VTGACVAGSLCIFGSVLCTLVQELLEVEGDLQLALESSEKHIKNHHQVCIFVKDFGIEVVVQKPIKTIQPKYICHQELTP